MKTSFKSLLAVAALGASALTSQAQTATKILVLDIGKAVQAHYKAAEIEEALKSQLQKDQQQATLMQKDLSDLESKIRELDEQSKNPAITKEALAKLQTDGEKIVQEYQSKRGELENFAAKSNRDLNERKQNGLTSLVEDITKKGAELAKKKGADLLLPKNQIIFNNPTWEITDEVITEINKDKPAGTAAKPAAPAAPAAKPAQTDESAPTVVFPGAKK